MFRRNVLPVSDVIMKLLRQQGLETPLMQKRLLDSWEKVAGAAIARYTGKKFIKNQTLFIQINNPALRQDLSMMRSQLVKRLNEEVRYQIITEIKFY